MRITRRLCSLHVVVAACFVLPAAVAEPAAAAGPSAESAASSNPAAIRENFTTTPVGGLPAGWTSEGGTFQVKDAQLRGTSTSATTVPTVWLPGNNWQNICIEVDATFDSAADPARWLAIVVRDRGPEQPGMQLTVRKDTTRGNGVEIAARRPAPEAGWRIFQTGSTEAATGPVTVCKVKMLVRGPWIEGYIDDALVVRSPRGDEASSRGRVGLRLNGITVTVSRVTVTPLPTNTSHVPPLVRTRPLAVGHRGFSWIAPENTLASYRKAIEAGADLAECDVYLTADRVPILLHDRTFKRTTGVDAKPADLTLAQVKKLDAGKWKSPEYVGEPVPTLEEALRLVQGKLRFVIEIKEEGIVPEVFKAIESAGSSPQDVVIFSFSRQAVEVVGRAEPLIPAVWLLDRVPIGREKRLAVIADARRARVSGVGMSLDRADPDFIRLAHESGLLTFVWTVNDPVDMRYLVRIGVDAIISDRPDVLLDVLGR